MWSGLDIDIHDESDNLPYMPTMRQGDRGTVKQTRGRGDTVKLQGKRMTP
jgi:hypothetical protein